ncbi:unnamed protein product [Trichobilharzia szidati]|nr:unnamed protein product [Trichobilharzia szidati]
MTTLPSCMYWTFTNSGLLIQDWLLKPVRPVNLNEAINQLYLSSSVDYHQPNSNHHQLNFNNNNTLSNDNIQQVLQIIFYFSLPLIPAATILFTIINIFIESKYYICPKYTLFTRPYIQRLSQYLIVFYVLTGINSSLIWLSTLPRYIPMSIGNYITLTNNNNNDHLINKHNSNVTNQYNSHLLMNSSSSSPPPSSYDSNITPKFLTQLPAILTMQIVLRLTLCWLIIGIIIDRIYILGELYINPMTKSFNHYINYLYTLIKENLSENCYLNTLTTHSVNDNCLTDKQIQKGGKCSAFQQIFKFAAKLCSIQKCSIRSCPICKQMNYNLENEYTCFVCKSNYLYNTNLLCHGDEKQQQQQQSDENLYLNSSIIPNKTTQCTSIGRLILTTGLLITCSLAICLPQVWSYQLIGINLKIKLTNGNSKNRIEKMYPAWRLLNRNSQTIYEYCFAAVSFVIPCCTIIVCLLLLIMRLIKIKCEFKHIYLHGSNVRDIKFYKLYENIVKYCLTHLIQDCILVLIIAVIQLCCSLPHLMTNSINRLECLLVSSSKASSIPSTSPSSSPSSSASSSGAEATDTYWPTRQNWLLIELSCLFGDFLIQLVILSIRLCETNHLLTANFPLQNFENGWLKKCSLSNMDKQNYASVQCQHTVQQNDCDVEHLMKMQELDEDVSKAMDEDSYESNHQVGEEEEDNDGDSDDDFREGDVIGNENRQRTLVYSMKTPTDSGQTSKNISPLPISHTISDVLLSPKFKSKQGMYRLNVQNKVHRSSPSTFTSPLLQRIPENINYQNSCHSFTMNNTMAKPTVTAITKGSLNTYVEPKTNMASLTYSPRSRHPCRLQTRISSDPLKSTNYNNLNNNRIHLSTASSVNQSKQITATPNMNTLRLYQSRWIDNNSPPPLPPPPKHLMYMLGEDSSIYSTPHGSPQQFGTRKQMLLNNNSNSNNNNKITITNTCNNSTNISLGYSPNISRLTHHISKHESPNAMSFRQTDSGVTGLGGSLIDSENYESNTVIT